MPLLVLLLALNFLSQQLLAIPERVDQVAAVVDDEIVTLSDLIWLIGYRNFTVPEDPQQKRDFYLDILNQLVEQKLIAEEAQQTPFIEVTETEVTEFIERYRQQFESEEAFQAKLERMGMSLADLRDLVRRQLAVNEFVALRFEPFTIVLPDEIQEYYQEEFASQLELTETVEENIRQILTIEKTQRELERWVQNNRRKARIRILLYRDPPESANLPDAILEEIQSEEMEPQPQ